jgi:hypothetical protein
MDLIDILNVPLGKYRVFGRDNFDGTYFIIEDCNNPDKAITLARDKEKEEISINGEGNEIAATFYVINNNLDFLYGLPLGKLYKDLSEI